MAFSNGLKSPQNESSFPTYANPMRPIGSQMSSSTASATPAERAGLHRRFTTNALPTLTTLSSMSPLSPIGQQRRQAAEPSSDLAAIQKVQLLQKRKEEFEHLREQRKRFQTELELMDLRAKAEEHELHRLEQDINHRYSLSGPQSEPTTPPEYRENGFPSAISRPNRLSMHSLTSAQGIGSIASPRTNRSGSQSYAAAFNMSQNNFSSMPGSRRGSDEEEDAYQQVIPEINRRPAGANLNRKSMPVTSRDMRSMPDVNSVLGINNIDALVGEDEEDTLGPRSNDGVSLLHMDTTSDGFPVLGRYAQQSSNSSALDLNNMSVSGDEAPSNGWPTTFTRHRPNQSMSSLSIRNGQVEETDANNSNPYGAPKKSNRYSLDAHPSFANLPEPSTKRSSLHGPINGGSNGMPKLQSSYSTNDIPTRKNSALTDVANLSHAEQHLQQHNANLGRIPVTNHASNRQSRDMSELRSDENTIRPISSVLQPNAPVFGPPVTSSSNQGSNFTSPSIGSNTMNHTFSPQAPYYTGYNMSNGGSNGLQSGGMAMLNAGMGNMNMGTAQTQWGNQMMYNNPYGGYGGGYQQFGNGHGHGQGRQQDSQARVVAARRQQGAELADNSRFANAKIEDMRPQIYDLCKDQHGCRFLQRKLEERDPTHLEIIFEETKDHAVELMIDPFGNYLCQKLLEFSNDQQRTVLIRNAAPNMVAIAMNQHGTRALQKMIEFISTPEQIDIVKGAFSSDVVPMIHDLNGNHVIQKCLNHLRPEDAEFIFTAVAKNCLIVGTHRHGCCVLQRCIDHALGDEKSKLVHAVIEHAYSLVQDPFGNYVVQYILDLNTPAYTRPLCESFRTCTVELAKQKFSSNVIEKCLRVSDPETSRLLIEEFVIPPNEMEKLLKDHYANYVVQTALEHGDSDMKARLWDIVIPLIPAIRSTPCGRRLVSKLHARDAAEGSNVGGQFTPESTTPPATTPQRQLSNQTYQSPTNMSNHSNGFGSQIASPQPHRHSNTIVPTHLQNTANQYPAYNRGYAQGFGNGYGAYGQAGMNGQGYGAAQYGQANGQSYSSPQQGSVNGQGYGSQQGSVNGQNYGGSQQSAGHTSDGSAQGQIASFF